MPRIIVFTIADLIAGAATEEEVREVIIRGVRAAEAAGYSPGSENLFGALCDRLRELASAEEDQLARQQLLRAAEIVCEIADELLTDGEGGRAA